MQTNKMFKLCGLIYLPIAFWTFAIYTTGYLFLNTTFLYTFFTSLKLSARRLLNAYLAVTLTTLHAETIQSKLRSFHTGRALSMPYVIFPEDDEDNPQPGYFSMFVDVFLFSTVCGLFSYVGCNTPVYYALFTGFHLMIDQLSMAGFINLSTAALNTFVIVYGKVAAIGPWHNLPKYHVLTKKAFFLAMSDPGCLIWLSLFFFILFVLGFAFVCYVKSHPPF